MSAFHIGALDFDVGYLNRLNLGMQLVREQQRRAYIKGGRDLNNPRYEAMIAVAYYAERGQREMRELIARRCAPWFDGSAFIEVAALEVLDEARDGATVGAAMRALERGDFNDQNVHEVMSRRVGSIGDYHKAKDLYEAAALAARHST